MNTLLGEQLKELRNQANLTVAQMADALGVVKGHISMIESGKRRPKLDILLRYADYFDKDILDLILLADLKKEVEDSLSASQKAQLREAIEDARKPHQTKFAELKQRVEERLSADLKDKGVFK